MLIKYFHQQNNFTLIFVTLTVLNFIDYLLSAAQAAAEFFKNNSQVEKNTNSAVEYLSCRFSTTSFPVLKIAIFM